MWNGREERSRGCRRPENLWLVGHAAKGKGMAWHSTEGHVYTYTILYHAYTYIGIAISTRLPGSVSVCIHLKPYIMLYKHRELAFHPRSTE